MKFTFTDKKVNLPKSLHNYAEKKVGKLDRYFKNEAEASLVFSVEKDRNKVGKQVVMAANEALVKERAPSLPEEVARSKVGAFVDKLVHNTTAVVTGAGMLTLSEETRDIRGGFIMVDGDVEINCAFETLVRLQREKLEKKVADVLFES